VAQVALRKVGISALLVGLKVIAVYFYSLVVLLYGQIQEATFMKFDSGFKKKAVGRNPVGRGFIKKYISTTMNGESITPPINTLIPNNGLTASYLSSFSTIQALCF